MALEIVNQCPLCQKNSFRQFHTCTDYLISGEKFEIQTCLHCSFLFTSPRPDASSLPAYYQSQNYVSHSGRPAGPINFLYIQARRFTLQAKVRLLGKLKNNPSVLDYGCGTGELLTACQSAGWPIEGVEPSPDARQKAEQITGIKIASELDQLHDNKFDIITLWHVLEHIADLNEKIAALKTNLKKEGILVIAVPNHESPDAKYYKEFWAGYDVPRHLWHFSKKTMTSLMATHHLQVKQILPMKLDSYYVSMLSEKYKNGEQRSLNNLFKGFLRGYSSNQKGKREMNYSSLIYIVTQ